MPDAIFDHPRLAAVYDAFEARHRADLDAYVDLVDELDAKSILDVGCGTGNLAIRLAERGLSVVGADPAWRSLEIARAKDRAGRVTWVHAGAGQLPEMGCDLAVMTGNVAQVFLTDEAWSGALDGVRGALRPGGHLVFETRRPERRVWEQWAAGIAQVSVDLPGIGVVERRREVTEVRPPFVSFRYDFTFHVDGAALPSVSTLRFRDRDEIEASLATAGYRVLEVRDAADRPGAEFVFLTQAAGG